MTTLTPSPSYTAPLFFVRSDSDPRRFYTVAQLDDRCACGQQISGLMHCSCPDHVHRARDCKHVRAVLAGAVRPVTPKARPALTLDEINDSLCGAA